MQTVVPHRLFDRLALLLVVLAAALPLAYLEAAHHNVQDLQHAFGGLGIKSPSHTVARPTPATTRPVAAPKVVTPVIKTATTTTLVHLRSAKSVTSTNLTNLQPGTVVQLRDDADATWQGVRYRGQSGYIYKDYLQY